MPSSDYPLAAGGAASPHDALLALRARAEKRRQLVTQAAEHHTPEEVQRLVQELQVHQIELEMQYEELLLTQVEVQDARAQYVDLYEFAPVGYFTLTKTGLVVQLNLCGSQQLGSVRQRLVGRRFALFVAPDQRHDFGQFLARVFQSDGTQSRELHLQREDGSLFYGQLEALRVETPDGDVCRMALVDTTARRQAADALKASEARFRKLFTDSSDAVALLQGHEYVDCNDAALRLLGATHREALVGQPAWAHTPEYQPDGRRTVDLFRDSIAQAVRTGSQRCESMMHKVSGQEIWVEAVLTPIEVRGPRPLVHVLWRDITAARAAAEELRLSQERLQMALEASASGVWVWEIATHELSWDAQAQAMFGLAYNPVPVSFEVLSDAIHAADRAAVAAGLRRASEPGAPSFDLEHRVVWPDGRVRYVAALGKVLTDAEGRPQRFIGSMRDVTPRREAEEALRREKELSESLLENTIDGIIALDSDSRITSWNAEAARYFGQPAAAVLGRPVFEVLSFMQEKAHTAVRQALAGERTVCRHQPFVVRPGHYDAYLVPLTDDGKPQLSGVLIIIRDVTERDRLAEEVTQQRLRQQQEVLAAILTTQETERKRIAEAIHNGLGQLLYAAKLSLEDRNPPARPRESLKLLDEAIRTTRTISFELTPGILEDFGLRTALEELVKRIAPARLPVRLHLTNLDQRSDPKVEITVYRVVQELLNNVMKHAHATEVEVHVAREANRLVVSVEDNGRGFEPARLSAEPLAGMGLAGVRNRVALLGGELSINSVLGRGTIISFELAY
ncbi:PAS domain-containing sensor histidine kinase [Hymenobacter rubidus]|uniref:PAS domain-containing sensor histidine kinase n=1 Tax=Hymenobacter rubidus TaxID=1441626 RepID=UPI00191E0B53|nr:PAS domain S-box protein [Hymenobacter rubidus]